MYGAGQDNSATYDEVADPRSAGNVAGGPDGASNPMYGMGAGGDPGLYAEAQVSAFNPNSAPLYGGDAMYDQAAGGGGAPGAYLDVAPDGAGAGAPQSYLDIAPDSGPGVSNPTYVGPRSLSPVLAAGACVRGRCMRGVSACSFSLLLLLVVALPVSCRYGQASA